MAKLLSAGSSKGDADSLRALKTDLERWAGDPEAVQSSPFVRQVIERVRAQPSKQGAMLGLIALLAPQLVEVILPQFEGVRLRVPSGSQRASTVLRENAEGLPRSARASFLNAVLPGLNSKAREDLFEGAARVALVQPTELVAMAKALAPSSIIQVNSAIALTNARPDESWHVQNQLLELIRALPESDELFVHLLQKQPRTFLEGLKAVPNKLFRLDLFSAATDTKLWEGDSPPNAEQVLGFCQVFAREPDAFGTEAGEEQGVLLYNWSRHGWFDSLPEIALACPAPRFNHVKPMAFLRRLPERLQEEWTLRIWDWITTPDSFVVPDRFGTGDAFWNAVADLYVYDKAEKFLESLRRKHPSLYAHLESCRNVQDINPEGIPRAALGYLALEPRDWERLNVRDLEHHCGQQVTAAREAGRAWQVPVIRQSRNAILERLADYKPFAVASLGNPPHEEYAELLEFDSSDQPQRARYISLQRCCEVVGLSATDSLENLRRAAAKAHAALTGDQPGIQRIALRGILAFINPTVSAQGDSVTGTGTALIPSRG
jgi:hypothetical protein